MTLRLPRPLRALTWAGLGAWLAGGLAILGADGFVHRRSVDHIYAASDVLAAPVVLVLGAQVDPDGTPSPFLAGRLDVAKALFDAGKAQVILVSGDSATPRYNEPDGMRDYLVCHGVPAAKIVADYAGFDTYDSCVRAGRIYGVDQLIVVSQSYHLPRAVATCRQLGLQVSGVGDDSARRYRVLWRNGKLRERLANLKMVWDLVTHREPVLGPPENSVQRALG